ncbi:MAG TPA: VOC family protein [Candidatus Angelobacter sp.]|nr:VOC family protein [Candidatus Angelobacter sp.]
MAKTKNPPDGYNSLTPYLIVKGAAAAIDFYTNVFGATEIMRMPQPDGRIGHAELRIGDSVFMLADEFPEAEAMSPKTFGGTTVGLMIYVDDADSMFNKAISMGGKVKKPMVDQFYGDRNGTFEDPWGHKWTISTHVEDVTPEEMKQRMAAMKPK